MPEGPEIWRAAARIARALGNGPLLEVEVRHERMHGAEAALLGAQVVGVKARGKALLTSFSTGHTLYSHNQLYGVWRVTKGRAALAATTRSLRLRLQTAQGTAALYSATDVELFDHTSSRPHCRRACACCFRGNADGFVVVASRTRRAAPSPSCSASGQPCS